MYRTGPLDCIILEIAFFSGMTVATLYQSVEENVGLYLSWLRNGLPRSITDACSGYAKVGCARYYLVLL